MANTKRGTDAKKANSKKAPVDPSGGTPVVLKPASTDDNNQTAPDGTGNNNNNTGNAPVVNNNNAAAAAATTTVDVAVPGDTSSSQQALQQPADEVLNDSAAGTTTSASAVVADSAPGSAVLSTASPAKSAIVPASVILSATEPTSLPTEVTFELRRIVTDAVAKAARKGRKDLSTVQLLAELEYEDWTRSPTSKFATWPTGQAATVFSQLQVEILTQVKTLDFVFETPDTATGAAKAPTSASAAPATTTASAAPPKNGSAAAAAASSTSAAPTSTCLPLPVGEDDATITATRKAGPTVRAPTFRRTLEDNAVQYQGVHGRVIGLEQLDALTNNNAAIGTLLACLLDYLELVDSVLETRTGAGYALSGAGKSHDGVIDDVPTLIESVRLKRRALVILGVAFRADKTRLGLMRAEKLKNEFPDILGFKRLLEPAFQDEVQRLVNRFSGYRLTRLRDILLVECDDPQNLSADFGMDGVLKREEQQYDAVKRLAAMAYAVENAEYDRYHELLPGAINAAGGLLDPQRAMRIANSIRGAKLMGGTGSTTDHLGSAALTDATRSSAGKSGGKSAGAASTSSVAADDGGSKQMRDFQSQANRAIAAVQAEATKAIAAAARNAAASAAGKNNRGNSRQQERRRDDDDDDRGGHKRQHHRGHRGRH